MKYFLLNIITLLLLCSIVIFSQDDVRLELKKIEFKGNERFSSAILKEIISMKESPGWFWKFLNSFSSFGGEAVYFDSLDIQNDLLLLKNYYHSYGYFKTEINAEFKINKDDKEVELIYNINEGPYAVFNKYEIMGLEEMPEDVKKNVLKKWSIKNGTRFSEYAIQTNIDDILYEMLNNGYITARFDSTVIFKDTINNQADISIYFTTGKRYIINDIQIEKDGPGKDYVEDDLLKDIVGIKHGEIYKMNKIKQSQSRLYRTGLFSRVLISPEIQDTVGNYVPLKVSGTIGKMNELTPEILMNNQQNTFNFGLGGTYIRKNFLGSARKLTTGVSFLVQDFFKSDLSNFLKTLSLSDTTIFGLFDSKIRIEQPYMFQRPILGSFETYYQINKSSISGRKIYGGKVGLEFEMPPYTFVNYIFTSYNFEVTDEKYIRGINEFNIHTLSSVIGIDLRSFQTNDPIFPTDGHNISLLVEESNLVPYLISKTFNYEFDETLFYRILTSFAYYNGIGKRNWTTLNWKVKVGYLNNFRGSVINIPSQRKFFAGGSNSIRGWHARELIPYRKVIISERSTEPLLIDVGSFLLESSFEMRKKFLDEMGFVTFVDFGNVWPGYQKFRFDEIAIAAGFGFRYYTTFAPFRLDFGFKMYDPYDTTPFWNRKFFDVMEFHFGIGEAF